MQEYLKKETRTIFDISKDRLIRLTLIKLANKKFVFHLTVQHLVFDGWSWGIFSKEISQIYNDLLENNTVLLPDQDIQYHDFSLWQSQNLNEISSQKSIDFWKKQLEDIPLETKFPFDHKRPKEISGLGGREGIEINEVLSAKIKTLAKQSDSTVFMTMLTAFGALISLYSNESDICIGTPTGNRVRSRFEKIIGFFVNTIVFRMKFNEKLSFKENLKNNRKVFLDSLEHQDLSFEKLVDVLQPKRVLNLNPIFQIMFAWQNAPRPPLSFNQVEEERVVLKNGISPLDITFYMWEEKEKILGEIEFNVDILDRESIIHLKHNYIKLLEEITAEIDQPLSQVTGMSDYSQDALNKFNDTTMEHPNVLLHELFEDIVQKYPNKEAVVCGHSKITFKELNSKANKLAQKLVKQNVKGSFIGVSLSRTEQMLITILAILKAGANYLPLDPDFPDDRLKYILVDSGAKLLITTSNLKNKFDGINTEILLIETSSFELNLWTKSFDNLGIKLEKGALAYTIYTSGSTGNPKGVKVPHSAVVNFIKSMAKRPGITKDDRLLAVTTLSFDISVLEMFLPLSVGATVVLANSNDVGNGNNLVDLLGKENITILQATPATWKVLLLSGWKGNKELIGLCGGEAIQPRLIKDLLPHVGKLWNMYGPTETTVWSTCYEITNTEAPVFVGAPIDNTQINILDKNNKVLPLGVSGEVCIGGEGVTAGYHNRDELTSEKFIRLQGKGITYRTGDGGRILPNGQLVLSGRLDNQIKLRGFRIEPGEIENLIGKESGVKEVVVKVQRFEDMDERLIAFMVSDKDIKVDIDQLRFNLSVNLPDYMIPSHYTILDRFPRTPNGKIDKKLLVFSFSEVNKKEELKHSELFPFQNKLHEIWSKSLKYNSFGVSDNFFEIGGTSLLVLSMINKIEKEFKIKIELADFFENPTIQHLDGLISFNLNNKIKQTQLNEEVIVSSRTNKKDEDTIFGEI